MDHEKHTLPVTAPLPASTVEYHDHYEEKKINMESEAGIEQAYTFDKMNTAESAEYNPNESTTTTASKSKVSFYVRYRKFFQ